MNPRAQEYRRIYDIPTTSAPRERADDGVREPPAIVRDRGGLHADPATGKKEFYGEFLITRRAKTWWPHSHAAAIVELEQVMPKAYKQLRDITTRLENTTRTSRISNSRSRMSACSCCRRAAASAPATRPCEIATALVAEK